MIKEYMINNKSEQMEDFSEFIGDSHTLYPTKTSSEPSVKPEKKIDTENRSNSPWKEIEKVETDVVYDLVEQYKVDENPKKVILCTGAYRDENGDPYVLECVKTAEKIVELRNYDHEYLPILGDPEYRSCTMNLVFGKEAKKKENKIVTVQTVAGTGALRVLATFLSKFNIGNGSVYVSNPTWRNHYNIFREVGMTVDNYRYIKDGKFDFEGMCDDVMLAPDESLFLFHACAHNTTGFDPSLEQWKILEGFIRRKKHKVLFDMAYQGFASGSLEKDAFAVRYFTEMGHNICVAQTYSKNMGLYGERVGSLSIVTNSEKEKTNIESQLTKIIRAMYSTPSLYGSRLVKEVLRKSFSDISRKRFAGEVEKMNNRIVNIRKVFQTKLEEKKVSINTKQITEQKGMFYLSTLTPEQIDRLKTEFSIYIIPSGRISIVGLNMRNVDYVVDSIAQATHS